MVTSDPAGLVGGWKRLARSLATTPNRIDRLIRDVSESDAEMRVGDAWSLKERLGRLGSTERTFFQPALATVLKGDGAPPPDASGIDRTVDVDHHLRDVGELAARFRHVRSESLARLATVTFDPKVDTPERDTLRALLDVWVAHDAAHLNAMGVVVG